MGRTLDWGNRWQLGYNAGPVEERLGMRDGGWMQQVIVMGAKHGGMSTGCQLTGFSPFCRCLFLCAFSRFQWHRCFPVGLCAKEMGRRRL